MEICRVWQFIVAICVGISYIHTKTFSINEALAANTLSSTKESATPQAILGKISAKQSLKGKNLLKSSKSKKSKNIEETIKERLLVPKPLPKGFLLKSKLKNYNEKLESLRSSLSPLKHRSTYQITVPLKPTKLSVHKYRNQALTNSIRNDKHAHKHIPLLKSIGVLFDNLLTPESDEDIEPENQKYRKSISYRREDNDVVCQCSPKPKRSGGPELDSEKETIVAAESTPVEVKVAAAPAEFTLKANHTPAGDIGIRRKNPQLPLLSARNTSSRRRNYLGLLQRSSSPRHRGVERNLTRHYGGSQLNTRNKKEKTRGEHIEEDSGGPARNSSSSSRRIDGVGREGNGNNSTATNFTNIIQNQNSSYEHDTGNVSGIVRRNITNIEVENKNEIRENQTESTRDNKHDTGRLRSGSVSIDKEHGFREPVQPNATDANSDDRLGQNLTSDKRVPIGDGTSSTENKGVLPQTPTTLNSLPVHLMNLTVNDDNSNNKVVMIIDGYSHTRGVNGEKKIAERSISITP